MHAVEHWNFMVYPSHAPEWLQRLDRWALSAAFTLLYGKAYAVFALLFGFSFFLILDSWTARGIPFTGRFLWRLVILGCFGYFHSLVYWGDFLLIIAVLGTPLLILHGFSTRILAWLSALLLLQLPYLWDEIRAFIGHPPRVLSANSRFILNRLNEVYAHGTVLDVFRANACQGQLARFWWFLESGRCSQMLGLFLLGFLLGRSHVVEEKASRIALSKRVFSYSLVGLICVLMVRSSLRRYSALDATAALILSSYRDLALGSIWVAGLTLFFEMPKSKVLLRFLVPCGRMSLTCYVMQGLIGVPLFYGFGFGLFRYIGPFYSMILGCVLFACQCAATHLWLQTHAQGPLEWSWRRLTLLTFANPFHSRSRLGSVESQTASQSRHAPGL